MLLEWLKDRIGKQVTWPELPDGEIVLSNPYGKLVSVEEVPEGIKCKITDVITYYISWTLHGNYEFIVLPEVRVDTVKPNGDLVVRMLDGKLATVRPYSHDEHKFSQQFA